MQIGETLEVKSVGEWRSWLERNHASRTNIWLVFLKKSTGKQKLPYDMAVEEALCFGWIDGQIKSFDAEKYALRFTPRRPRANWSDTNLATVKRLLKEGRMTDAGLNVLPADCFPQASL